MKKSLLFIIGIIVFLGLFNTTVSAKDESSNQINYLKQQIDELTALVNNLIQQQQNNIIDGGWPEITIPQSNKNNLTLYSFSRNLKVGDYGSDVLELQKVLNNDPKTQIAFSGAGSPGNETKYFGYLTKDAVQKYQNMHAVEVLHPLGLFNGTGYFGQSTRDAINKTVRTKKDVSIVSSADEDAEKEIVVNQFTDVENYIEDEYLKKVQSIDPVIPDTVLTGEELLILYGALLKNGETIDSVLKPILVDSLEKLYLLKLSTSVGIPGENITFSGYGLEGGGNSLHFDQAHTITNITPIGDFASFMVPELPVGRYNLFFSNSRGVSDTLPFTITKEGVEAPIITSITPKSGVSGLEVTISGSGFVSHENVVYTGVEVLENISSVDGKTIVFTMRDTDGFGAEGVDWGGVPIVINNVVSDTLKYFKKPPILDQYKMKMRVHVENVNGKSNDVVYNIVYN